MTEAHGSARPEKAWRPRQLKARDGVVGLDLIEAYVADVPATRGRKQRRDNAERAAAFAAFIHPAPMLEATANDIRRWLNSLDLLPASRSHYVASIADVWDWLWMKGAVGGEQADNPARALQTVRRRWKPPVFTGLPPAGTDLPLGEATQLYLADRYGRGELTAKSVRAMESRLRLLVESLGPDLPLSCFNRRAVAKFQHDWSPHAASSRRAYQATTRSFATWCVAEGYLVQDPTASLPSVRQPRREPRALTRDQVAKLLAACRGDRGDTLLIWLGLGLGLRRAEIADLDFDDWDPDRATVHVKGKFGDERLLPAPARVAQALEDYLEERGRWSGPLLQPKRRYGDLDSRLSADQIGQRFARLAARAGIKRAPRDGISAHSLRHTAASDALERCGNVRTVQAILGHQSLQSTQIYLRRADLSQMREALGTEYSTPEGA